MEIPVLHLVNRFWIGGAERQFVERLRRHPAGFEAVLGCLELSGPLLDRLDMQLFVPRLTRGELMSSDAGEGSPLIRARVKEARERQRVRLAGGRRPSPRARRDEAGARRARPVHPERRFA